MSRGTGRKGRSGPMSSIADVTVQVSEHGSAAAENVSWQYAAGRLSWALQFVGTPSCQNRKLRMSVFSSICLLMGLPPEWPDFVS